MVEGVGLVVRRVWIRRVVWVWREVRVVVCRGVGGGEESRDAVQWARRVV